MKLFFKNDGPLINRKINPARFIHPTVKRQSTIKFQVVQYNKSLSGEMDRITFGCYSFDMKGNASIGYVKVLLKFTPGMLKGKTFITKIFLINLI
ncbi:MAG: hypothetical protein EBT60_01635 [Bacteroidetes bacterium]|nr:hypothetical protein [Bacteroidota bacterium]